MAAIADEWLSPNADAGEVALRLAIAFERARVRRQSTRRNFIDQLTGLPNRRAILRALIRESVRVRRQGGALSMALIDIDDFKRVNDTYGHAAGDKLLRRIGLVLGGITRGNELSGRLGGDEFAVVIGGQLADAARAAERAKRALRRVGVFASAGTAEWAQGEQLRALYRRADESLKASKANKRSFSRIRRPPKSPVRERRPAAWTQTELFAAKALREVAAD
jgi:diguanylate cyclase (GGDEF)-like protein